MATTLKICFAASEAVPFAKTGGLADVAGALSRQLHRLGHDVRLFLPLYDVVDRSRHRLYPVEFARDVPVQLGAREYRFTLQTARLPDSDLWAYLVDCPALYHRGELYTTGADEAQRFALFSRAVIESCQRMGWGPDLFHCNDWHAALLPLLLRSVYDWDTLLRPAKTVLTIHNIGFQGVFPFGTVEALGLAPWAHLFDQEDARAGRVNFLRTGLIYADVVTTVSPTYAREIQTPEYGMGLEDLLRARSGTLVGILNGVDYDEWSPEQDRLIPHRYSLDQPDGKRDNKRFLLEQLGLPVDGETPLIGVVSRLTSQKGFDLCADVLPGLLASTPVRLAVLGTGEAVYEQLFAGLQRRYPRQVAFYRGYSNELAHLIEAGADLFLMPSRYEPCGLNQMFSLRYGTIPVVRRTGGLADSVQLFDEHSGEGTGVVFDSFDAAGLGWALRYALSIYARPELWRKLMANAMAQDFSWERQTASYLQLYSWLLNR